MPFVIWLCLLVQDPEIEKLKKQMAELDKKYEEVKQRQADTQDQLEELQQQYEKERKELNQKLEAAIRIASQTALNPKITAFGNLAGRWDNQKVFDPDGKDIHSEPFLRSFEFDFRAAIDPYAEAVGIVSLEGGPDREFSVDAEEAYALIKRLPILESTILGSKIQVGKFRAPFGQSNRLHMHDMPQITRPLAVAKYLGTEHGEFFESGWAPVGGDLSFNPVPADFPVTVDVDLALVRSGDIGLSKGNDPNHAGYFGHLQAFRKLTDAIQVTAGTSGYLETGEQTVKMMGADLLVKWKPPVAGEWHSIVAGGEVFYSDRAFFKDLDGDGIKENNHSKPLGGYAYAQYQVSFNLYVGGRFDWVEDPDDQTLRTQVWGATVTYYTSEFLRFRVGFEHRKSDIDVEDGTNTVLFEVNFVYGSHPIEPYWVSR